MAVEVTLKWQDKGYSDERAEEVYQVTGVANETEATRANGAPIGQVPQLNATHPRNSLLKAEKPFARQTGFNFYEVLVVYTIPEFGEHSDPGGNPLDEPWEIGFDVAISSEPTDGDAYLNPLLNSAHDVFDPPQTNEYYEWTILLTHNELFFDFGKALSFKNTINSDDVVIFGYTFPVGCLKCVKILPTQRYKKTAAYVNIGVELKFREYFGKPEDGPSLAFSPFNHWLLDRGYNGWYNDGGLKKGRILDNKLQEVQIPVILNAQGKPFDTDHFAVGKADEGHTAVNSPTPSVPHGAEVSSVGGPSAPTAYYLVYKKCLYAAFSALNLPT